MKKMNSILRKCKSLSRQLSRSSSYRSLRSKSPGNKIEDLWGTSPANNYMNKQDQVEEEEHEHDEIIYVGSTRKRYVISSKYLSHPLLNALIDKSSNAKGTDHSTDEGVLAIRCEVVLFDHLLLMLENSDPNLRSESFEELAELYVF